MAARQLKQQQVGELVGMDQGDVSRVARGLRLPNLKQTLAFDRKLGIQPSWWLEPAPAEAEEPAESGPGGDSEDPSVRREAS